MFFFLFVQNSQDYLAVVILKFPRSWEKSQTVETLPRFQFYATLLIT